MLDFMLAMQWCDISIEFILFILVNNVICIKYVTYVRVHHRWLGAPAGGWITKQDEAQEQGRLELF